MAQTYQGALSSITTPSNAGRVSGAEDVRRRRSASGIRTGRPPDSEATRTVAVTSGSSFRITRWATSSVAPRSSVVVVSSTEGDDVVNKHPMMFRGATIGVINKVDLAPLVGADLDRMVRDIARYNPAMPVFRTNLKTGEGAEALLDEILK